MSGWDNARVRGFPPSRSKAAGREATATWNAHDAVRVHPSPRLDALGRQGLALGPVIHPDTCLRLVDDHVGQGVFATRVIPRGTVVWLHDELDQILLPERVAGLPELLRQQVERYGYLNARSELVLCWDHARYMNHSCEPSTTSVGTLMEIARRDIQPGEELTCEYGLAHVIEAFECRCGAPSCRGALQPTDLPAVWQRWDQEMAAAFGWALDVPQPVLAAARTTGPGAWLVQAILEKRRVTLPSWSEGVPGGA